MCKKNKHWLIWLIASATSAILITIGIITFIKVKAKRLNKALFEASEYIAFDDDEMDEMMGIIDEDDQCECGDCADKQDSETAEEIIEEAIIEALNKEESQG